MHQELKPATEMNKNLPVRCSTQFSMEKKKKKEKKKGKEQIVKVSVIEKKARQNKIKSLLNKSTKFMHIVCAPFMALNFLSSKFS